MPEMTPLQRARFGATAGAYSAVTDTEADHDRSVTIDRAEKRVLELLYPIDGFPRGSGSSRFQFVVHNRTDHTRMATEPLAIKFPKMLGNELRLYMSSANSFDAQRGDVFYIFVLGTDQHPHVGFMPFADWQAGATTLPDDEDEKYQALVFAEIGKAASSTTVLRIPRNLKAAVTAIKNAGFLCEVDNGHKTFSCSATGMPYVEAHHLMPLSVQHSLGAGRNLDVPENIVALCPTCHRRFHHEEKASRIVLLMQVYEQRKAALNTAGVNYGPADLLKAYGLV